MVDIPNDSSTTARVGVDDRVTNTLEVVGDRDWIGVELEAGEGYIFTLDGAEGSGGLPDPFLRFYAPDSSFIDSDDDDGPSLNSKLLHISAQAGLHYLSAGAFADDGAGDYRLGVTQAPELSVGDIAENDLHDDTDKDLYKVVLEEGERYLFTQVGTGEPFALLDDPKLRLWDETGVLIDVDDDSGTDFNAALEFEAPADGTYFLVPGAVSGAGEYTLGVGLVIEGDDGDNTLKGTTAGDLIRGFGGKDKLIGKDGADILEGGDGDDKLFGDDGKDLLRGGDGHDRLEGGDEADELFGGAGNDTLKGGNGGDALRGDDGDDKLYGNKGDDFLEGGEGRDLLEGGDGEDSLFGGGGRDTLKGGHDDDRLDGGGDDDKLYGNDGDDVLLGGAGDDRLYGGHGNDRLVGDIGNDKLYGGNGVDSMNGFDGDDLVEGGAGDDNIGGGRGTIRSAAATAKTRSSVMTGSTIFPGATAMTGCTCPAPATTPCPAATAMTCSSSPPSAPMPA